VRLKQQSAIDLLVSEDKKPICIHGGITPVYGAAAVDVSTLRR
jgi:hypothetical protein